MPWRGGRHGLCPAGARETAQGAGVHLRVRGGTGGGQPPLDAVPPVTSPIQREPSMSPMDCEEKGSMRAARVRSSVAIRQARGRQELLFSNPCSAGKAPAAAACAHSRFVSTECSHWAPRPRTASLGWHGVGGGPGRPPGARCRRGRLPADRGATVPGDHRDGAFCAGTGPRGRSSLGRWVPAGWPPGTERGPWSMGPREAFVWPLGRSRPEFRVGAGAPPRGTT